MSSYVHQEAKIWSVVKIGRSKYQAIGRMPNGVMLWKGSGPTIYTLIENAQGEWGLGRYDNKLFAHPIAQQFSRLAENIRRYVRAQQKRGSAITPAGIWRNPSVRKNIFAFNNPGSAQAVLAENFVRGANSGVASSMYIHGDKIYSYGPHFPIARREGGMIVVTSRRSPSKTTSAQIGLIKRAAQAAGLETMYQDLAPEAKGPAAYSNPGKIRKNIFLFNNPRELNEMERAAAAVGLAVTTWAPGDGQTRYRFFVAKPGSPYADYHQGDGLYTALGRKDAMAFVRAYGLSRGKVRTNPSYSGQKSNPCLNNPTCVNPSHPHGAVENPWGRERRSYTDYIARKRAEYGDKFDSSDLAPQFVPYYESGQRIEVEFISSTTGEPYETKRGTVGATTGWKPIFLLMLTRRSVGSSYTLGKQDRVIRVISNPLTVSEGREIADEARREALVGGQIKSPGSRGFHLGRADGMVDVVKKYGPDFARSNPFLQTVLMANPPISGQWDRMTGQQRLHILGFVGFDETASRYVRLPWKLLSNMVKQALEQYWNDTSSSRGTTRRRMMPVGANPKQPVYLIEGCKTPYGSVGLRRMSGWRTFRSSSLEAARAEANRIFKETGIVVGITKEGSHANPLTRREAGKTLRQAHAELRHGAQFRPGHTRSSMSGQAFGRAQTVVRFGPRAARPAARKVIKRAMSQAGTTMSNPGGLRLPAPGTKMTVAQALQLARRIGNRELIQQCQEAAKLQSKANSNAKSVTWKHLPLGSKNTVDAVVALVHYGDSPEDMYKPPKGSRKGQHMYRHTWGDGTGKKRPVPVLAAPGGKMIVKLMGPGQKVGDWMRG